MPFLLDGNPTTSEISDAVNYLLSNFDTTYTADSTSGQVIGPTGQVVGYLYKYISVKYADNFDGSLNFSNTPTGRLYYGIRNSNDSVESTNPADYIWRKVTGGFGTTKFLYYETTGGRQINFVVSTTNPTANYLVDDGTSIDLDLLTAGRGRQIAYPTIYKWTTANTAPARPSTTTIFTWATASYTAPSGWATTPPSATSTDYYLWAITVPLSANVNDLTSVCDWTNTSYAIYKLVANGSSGENGLSSITAYLVQSQASSTPTFTTPTTGATIPPGWVGTAPAVSVGQVMWYIQGRYNSSTTVTINGVAPNTTAWTGPIAASIFQDIRSDNWNGSNPPISGNPSTWGTAGYYIERTSGSSYLNNLYARGTLQSGSTPAVSGTTMTGSGGVINSTGTFALGNSSTNISFNGSQMTLNGNVVATGNIVSNGVTNAGSFAGNLYPLAVVQNNWAVSSTYYGGWDANSNSPFLSSGSGPLNGYYYCYIAGNTSLNGISNWYLGDLPFFDGSVWTKAWQTIATITVNFPEVTQNVLINAAINLLALAGGNTTRVKVVEIYSGAVSYDNGTYHTSSTVLPFLYSFSGAAIGSGTRTFQLQINQQVGSSYVVGNVSFSILGVKR